MNGGESSYHIFAWTVSDCSRVLGVPIREKGGDLGWFPRGKMAGPFQDVAFNTPVGVTSAPFKSTYDY